MKVLMLFLALALGGCLVGCGQSKTSADVSKQVDYNTYSTTQSGIYDSEDAAVVVKKNTDEKTIQLQNITSSRRYTLNYDGTTTVYDRYDQALSMEQIQLGSVVTVRFYKATKSLTYVKENPDCVSLSDVSGYSMDLSRGTITIGSDVYNISGHVVVISDGRETDMMEVNQVDVLNIWGYKNMIYGISIEKGHGYLRLSNEDYFVGGWLEVGNSLIRMITEDMLLVVPEGTYDVDVSNKGTAATKAITFNRNEEVSWDLGEIEIAQPKEGNILFTLTPLNANVVIDGDQIDTSSPVTLTYGIHRMQVSADGYESISQYIRVAQASANLSVELEKSSSENNSTEESTQEQSSEESSQASKTDSSKLEEEDDEESSESETESESDDLVESDGKYKVYIESPEGVEAYLDGNYIGITPVSFNKKAGSYVVSLRKNGYQTRSYTLQIDDEEKDVNYTFTELIALSD